MGQNGGQKWVKKGSKMSPIWGRFGVLEEDGYGLVFYSMWSPYFWGFSGLILGLKKGQFYLKNTDFHCFFTFFWSDFWSVKSCIFVFLLMYSRRCTIFDQWNVYLWIFIHMVKIGYFRVILRSFWWSKMALFQWMIHINIPLKVDINVFRIWIL